MSEKKEDLSILLKKKKKRIYNLKKHGNAFIVDWSLIKRFVIENHQRGRS